MARLDVLAARGRRFHVGRIPPLAIATLGVVCIAGGVDSIAQHLRSDFPEPYRASCALVLLAAGIAQLAIAWRLSRQQVEAAMHQLRQRAYWETLILGIVVSYAISLALGPDPSVRHLFRALVAAWCTVMWIALLRPVRRLVPRGASAGLASSAHKGYSKGAPFRARCLRASFAFSLALVAVEASLRVAVIVSPHALDRLHGPKATLTPGSEFQGRLVNGDGYWDEPFDVDRHSGRFRIAAIGGPVLLSGHARRECLTIVEQHVPGVEIYNLGLAHAQPALYATLVDPAVERYDADLVVAFFSIGGDLDSESPGSHVFDWRSHRLGALVAGRLPGEPCASVRVDESPDYESCLAAAGRRMAICRTPTGASAEARWQATLDRFDNLVQRCRTKRVPLVLVAAPAEFQANAALAETLRRRLGWPREQLDLELPQRRLARFAEERGIPVLDLLPFFRAAKARTMTDGAQAAWTSEGNQIAAEALGGWLKASYGPTILAQARLPAK